MELPTREEINVFDSLDERSACTRFYGKTLEQAESLFRDNFLSYQEDLIWMAAVAVRFYVPAAIRYLQSEEAKGDADAVFCFIGLLEVRLASESKELKMIAQELENVCRYILAHYSEFEISPGIYGDLRPRYEKVIQALLAR